METEEVIKKRKEIEATGNIVPELEKPIQKPLKPRFDRRLEKKKKEILDKLVLDFFTQRSAISDPEGEEVAKLFDKYRDLWFSECRNFNMHRTPFKLRYESFAESVEFYLKMEKDQMKQTEEANKLKDFDHWFRRSHVWRTKSLSAILYWLLALGNKEKQINRWKDYYRRIQNATS
jgi:hypothetical protein